MRSFTSGIHASLGQATDWVGELVTIHDLWGPSLLFVLKLYLNYGLMGNVSLVLMSS